MSLVKQKRTHSLVSRFDTDEFALFSEQFTQQVQEFMEEYNENYFFDGEINWTFKDGNWIIVADISATEYSK